MNAVRNSRILLALLSLALAGLTGILAVLLHGAWQAKEQALERNVQTALAATVQQLEVNEIAGDANHFITGELDAYFAGNPDFPVGGAHTMHPELFKVAKDSLRIFRYQLPQAQRTGKNLVVEIAPSAAHVDLRADELTFLLEGERTSLVRRVVGDLVRLRPRTITERLTSARIDSVLGANLRDLDIGAAPRFAVVDTASGESVLSNLADPAPLLAAAPNTSPVHRARLFPLDLAPPHFELVVDLPDSRALVLAQVWPLGAASIAFLLVTMAAFAQALRTIDRQRRFAGQVVDFINNMTHEFKTPLATVSLACQALVRRGPDADSARYLAMIDEENTRLGRQVEKILQMAQLERGGVVRGGESVDMVAVAARSAEVFALQAEQTGGVLEARLPADAALVTGDPVHLAAIVDNLLDNAVKYARGAPCVALTVERHADNVVLDVRDQGPGIARTDQERLFEPYYRCSTGNRHDVKGFGLGLSFVKLLTELHGGRVSLDSRPGRGTRIVVHLPRADVQDIAS